MKKPPKSTGAPARCRDAEVRKIATEAGTWSTKVEEILQGQRSVADTLRGLANAYAAYPAKRSYLNAVADAVEGVLIKKHIEPLSDDLKKAQRCIWDDRYVRSGCRYIPLDCFDRGELESRIIGLQPYLKEVADDLRANRPRLLEGLPSSHPPNSPFVACSEQIPPCRQHMNNALDVIIRAQKRLEEMAEP